MKLGFMSSVLPRETLRGLVDVARRYGYTGIEFRPEWGHGHGIELGTAPWRLREARAVLADAGVAATCLATGVRFNALDVEEQRVNRAPLRQYIVLAAEVGAPLVRTFADALPENDAALREQALDLAAASYAAVDAWAGQHGVTVLVETHTNMLAQYARAIVERTAGAHLGVLWHSAHHLLREQSVSEAYGQLRGWVRHLHYVADRRQQAPSEHDNVEQFRLLLQDGFEGYASVELINPSEPQQVLAEHRRAFDRHLAAAGQGHPRV